MDRENEKEKATVMNGIILEMLKYSGVSIADWFVRIINNIYGVWCYVKILEVSVYRPSL